VIKTIQNVESSFDKNNLKTIRKR